MATSRPRFRTPSPRPGVYRQAFYDSFEDKEDCYLQALDAGSAWVELAMREAAAGETTWRGQLRGALSGLLSFLDEQPEMGRALLVEVHAAGAAGGGEANRGDGAGGGDDGPGAGGEATTAPRRSRPRRSWRGSSPSSTPASRSGQAEGYLRLLPELMYLAVLPVSSAPRRRAAAMRSSRS